APRRQGLYRAARLDTRVREADRDQGRDRQGGVLSGRGLSPGLRGQEPDASLYRDQRSAQGRAAQGAVRGCLQRNADDGREREDGGALKGEVRRRYCFQLVKASNR